MIELSNMVVNVTKCLMDTGKVIYKVKVRTRTTNTEVRECDTWEEVEKFIVVRGVMPLDWEAGIAKEQLNDR